MLRNSLLWKVLITKSIEIFWKESFAKERVKYSLQIKRARFKRKKLSWKKSQCQKAYCTRMFLLDDQLAISYRLNKEVHADSRVKPGQFYTILIRI